MDDTNRKISLSVDGSFITDLARTHFYEDGSGKNAVELLMACLETDEISDVERYYRALAILDGRAEIVGIYPGDDYGYKVLEEKDEKYDIVNYVSVISKENKELKEQMNVLECFFFEAIDELTETTRNKLIRNMMNEEYVKDSVMEALKSYYTPEATSDNMVDSFIKRMNDDNEDDYGWLEPNGKFHPVEWGEHNKWADEYIRLHMQHDHERAGTLSPERNRTAVLSGTYGDFLVSKGWVLLHNPAQGVAVITKDPVKSLTKAQKEFLYDYYMERDCTEEAMAIWEDENIISTESNVFKQPVLCKNLDERPYTGKRNVKGYVTVKTSEEAPDLDGFFNGDPDYDTVEGITRGKTYKVIAVEGHGDVEDVTIIDDYGREITLSDFFFKK